MLLFVFLLQLLFSTAQPTQSTPTLSEASTHTVRSEMSSKVRDKLSKNEHLRINLNIFPSLLAIINLQVLIRPCVFSHFVDQ